MQYKFAFRDDPKCFDEVEAVQRWRAVVYLCLYLALEGIWERWGVSRKTQAAIVTAPLKYALKNDEHLADDASGVGTDKWYDALVWGRFSGGFNEGFKDKDKAPWWFAVWDLKNWLAPSAASARLCSRCSFAMHETALYSLPSHGHYEMCNLLWLR